MRQRRLDHAPFRQDVERQEIDSRASGAPGRPPWLSGGPSIRLDGRMKSNLDARWQPHTQRLRNASHCAIGDGLNTGELTHVRFRQPHTHDQLRCGTLPCLGRRAEHGR
jgi:hypothetical protein